MIEFERVSVRYPNGKAVLKEVSFRIEASEQVGLIGANGAGKSTLMKAALGLLPYEGAITVDGLRVEPANFPQIRQKLGFLLQDSEDQMFMPTVLEDMMFGPMNYGKSRAEAKKAAQEMLQTLQLTHLEGAHNHKISGGEKRMAAIATILTMQPLAVLMDEPSASLDPYNRRTLIRTLNRLSKLTKIIASHDLDMILETCDRVLLLSNGSVVADAAAETILTDQKLLEQHRLELPFCLAGVPKRRK